MTSEPQQRIPPGLRFMAESSLYFSLMSVCVKWASERGVPWEQLVFARSIFAVVVTWVWLKKLGIDPWGNQKGWLVSRGVFGVMALMCFYYALSSLPLGDATVIQFTNPAFVGVFAVFLLGERLRPQYLLATGACLVGVALVAQPSFLFGESRLPLDDVGIALSGAVVSGISYTIVRRLGRTEHSLVTVLYFPLVAAPITLPLAIAAGYVPNLGDLVPMFGVGFFSQLAQVRMTEGLKLESAARATAVTYLQVVFAFVWGVALFDEVPTVLTVAGAGIIVVTTALVSLSRKRGNGARMD